MNDQNNLEIRLNEVLLAADNQSLVTFVKMLAKDDIDSVRPETKFLAAQGQDGRYAALAVRLINQ